MKIKFVLFAVFFITAILFSTGNNTWADFSFDEIKMVGTEYSTLEQYYFGMDETPWLYLKLPDSPFDGPMGDLNITFSSWESPEAMTYSMSGGVSLDRENWLTLPYWDSVKTPGEWDVNAKYIGLAGIGCGHTSFTVTPEPWAMVLMAIGGIPIAANLYRKRKRA